MKSSPTPVPIPDPAALPAAEGWRRHITGQRLRLFILLSVAAHLVLGMSWGVPAYVKQKRLEAEQRRQEMLSEQQRKASEAALADARARDLARTAEDVKNQTRKAFEKLADDLSQAVKEKTWAAVEPKVQPAEKQLADALGDRSMTEQDLRNLQANLDRQLVQSVNETLGADASREETEAFLAGVESKVVPELIAHYKSQSGPKVAQPVRSTADAFVRTTRDETGAAISATEADRQALGAELKQLGDEVDAAGGDVDQAQSLSARKAAPAADEIHRHATAAAGHLGAAAKSAEAAAEGLSKLSDRVKILNGGADLTDRLAAAADSLARVHDAIKLASAGLAAGNYAEGARQLTAAALAQRKLATQWSSASEAATQSASAAGESALASLALVKDNPVPQHIDQHLADAFRDKASQRLADVLADALRKRLTAAGVKPDEAAISAAAKRVKEVLETKVGAAGGYGASTSQTLRDAAASARRAGADDDEHLAARFTQSAEPVIVAGVTDVVTDTSLDARLADLVAKPEKDPGRDDVRDRVAMLAARAADGRANSLDTVSLTDLRASAIARSADTDRTGGADANVPTTGPADAPPVVEDIKKEILAALKAELQKVFEGKLPDDQAARVWDHVAKASDGDVNHLAQDLIDPKVSDSDLESRRVAFSGKFLDSVREGLDKTASDDVARALLKELEGTAGDTIAGTFKNAVKDNVGGALAREWRGAADADRAKAAQQVRDIRDALDTARAVADKSAQVLDQVKEETARASREAKGDAAAARQAADAASGKLAEIHAAIEGAKGDMDKAQKNLPDGSAELKDHLAEIGKSFDSAAGSVSDADKTAKSGDAAATVKAVADARKEIEKFRSGLGRGRAGLDREAAQADAQFTKAAQQASEDSAGGTPGVKSRIESKFDGEFRKEALPRLTDQIVKGFEQKLEKAGVSADAKDAEALRHAVSAALDKKVTGEAHVGDEALAELDRRHAFENAKNARAEPTTQQVDRANAIADKVTAAGVATAVGGDAGDKAADGAARSLAGPDRGVVELKDKVARMQGQLRGGRGGLLADGGDQPDAQGDNASVQGMRRKWQGILAGLNGDGNGGNGAAGKGAAASAGAAGNGAAGAGAGAGPAGSGLARGPGGGLFDFNYFGRGIWHHVPYDEQKRRELTALLKDRAKQQGQDWGRQGADGDAGLGATSSMRPSAIVAPATRPAQTAANDQPYAPTFKSLRFAVVPYLNQPIPIGDSFDAWKDVPAIHLRPELGWVTSPTGLKVVDDLPLKVAWDNHGLYFMVDMVRGDGKITKNRTDTFWYCDCMEVFIDTMNTKELRRGNGAGQQFWYWPFGSQDDPKSPGGESLFDSHTGFNFMELKPKDLPCAARMTDAGYQMQCRVPIERVRDADLAPGKILGFNVTMETGTKLHYYWSASKVVGTSVHPDTWGDILLGGSDGRIEFPEKLASEVAPDAVTKALNAFPVGEALRIRVTDRDMNLNDKVKDKVAVTVRNARREQEVVILEETGPDTGIFEGSVRTALAIGERIPGQVSVYEGESVSVTYIDQARANGARNTEIVSRIVAGPTVMTGR